MNINVSNKGIIVVLGSFRTVVLENFYFLLLSLVFKAPKISEGKF